MKISLRQRFGAQIKALRIASGLSQEAFADRCSIARSYMSRIERGGANPALDTVEVLAEALHVDPGAFFQPLQPVQRVKSIEVPYASDGTCFHPGLASSRDGSFRVGEKGAELRFGTFEEALDYLKGMDVAKWRRPNSSGNWGLVSAVRWGSLGD